MNKVVDIKKGLNSNDLAIIEEFKKTFIQLGNNLEKDGYITQVDNEFSDSSLGRKDLKIRFIDKANDRSLLIGLTPSAEMSWWTFNNTYTAVRTGYDLAGRRDIIQEFSNDAVALIRESAYEEKIYKLKTKPVYKELHFKKGGVMSKSLVFGGKILKRFAM